MEIMGGEPLLHPSIIEIIKIARQNFKGEINICTNGILVDKQSTEFFKACRDNEVSIAITKYPINLNWQRLKNCLLNMNLI
jgi:MoaA/NifB/PqqE/SkfB family radical SAM enzyme